MLVAKAALNYVEFMKTHFSKDVVGDEGLFIMPLGFKLPFAPEDFLTKKAIQSNASPESRQFIESVIKVIQDLKEDSVEDSIVLGFNIYLESVKKVTNSDLLVAITNKDEAEVSFTKTTAVRISDDPNAMPVQLSDEQFRGTYKYEYQELVDWCRENIDGFLLNQDFHKLKKTMAGKPEYIGRVKLNSRNPKSPYKDYYSEQAMEYIQQNYQVTKK